MSLTVLISGASSGLGRSLALQYAKQGATLGLIARRRELLKELSQEIPDAAIYVADVRDSDAMQAVAHDFVLHHGQPDIVIANA
ncbi:MAG: SDR family NAD(P)-dependent oxidoreductase, partial [Nitrosomonadaceae bacterium]